MTTSSTPLRVVQWGTGRVGKGALRTIIGHADLELAGVIVHDPAKVGRDAAELCGLPGATGVVATDDPDTALAGPVDAVCYTAVGTGAREQERAGAAVSEIAGLLQRGMNVVSTSVTPLIYPPVADAGWRAAIQQACAAGSTSCFMSGTHPGFASDLIPLMLSGLTGRFETITVTEVISFQSGTKPKLRTHFGFGQPVDREPPAVAAGFPTRTWGPVLTMLADALDVPVDHVDEVHESWATPVPLDTKIGDVAAGTRAGLRFSIRGMVGDHPALVVDHVYRAHDDAAPDWPAPPGVGGYRVEVVGDPSWTVDMAMTGADGTALAAGEVVTGVRVANAIPAVVAAPPGLLTPLLPLVTGRGLFRLPHRR